MEVNLDAHVEPTSHATNVSPSASVTINPSVTKEPREEPREEATQGKGKEKRKGKEGEKAGTRKTKSWVWDHFTKDPDDPKTYASCDYCSDVIKCPAKNGTTSLKNHLLRCRKYPYNDLDKKQKRLFFPNKSDVKDTGNGTSTFFSWSFSQELCNKYLARMIIIDELPFKTIEHQGFRDFINMLQPQFQIPSSAAITKACLDTYVLEKENLKKYFSKTKQRVSLTTDLCTSRQNLSYMCLTAHFIDRDWNIHKRILNFCPVSGHSGEIVGKYIEKCLLDWGIDKVLTVTVDNASSNDLCLRYLRRRFNIWKKSILDGKHLHMRCCAHILSLVVKEGLKDVDDSILRIRSAVKYVRSSSARIKRFKECIQATKIDSQSLVCLDVETRWNSTYMMLESAIKFQAAFDMLEEADSKYKAELESLKGIPTINDWNCAKSMLPFLRGFYNSTLRISGSLYVTSDSYFHEVFGIGAMIRNKMNATDENLKKMAGKMKVKYDKYGCNASNINIFLFIAPVLDPRHKLDYVSFILEKSYDAEKEKDLNDEIENVLGELFEQYSHVVGVANERSVTSTQHYLEEESAMEVDDDPTAFLRYQYKKSLEETTNSTGEKSELDRYLNEQREPSENKLDLLSWWKNNEARYPVMAAMAKDILAIPASIVASESAFSTGGRILDVFRSSLTPTTVEALICSQNWLRSKSVPFDIEESLEDLEKYEAELKDLPEAISIVTVDD